MDTTEQLQKEADEIRARGMKGLTAAEIEHNWNRLDEIETELRKRGALKVVTYDYDR